MKSLTIWQHFDSRSITSSDNIFTNKIRVRNGGKRSSLKHVLHILTTHNLCPSQDNEEQNLYKLTLWQFTRSTKCRSCPSFGAEKLMHFAFGHFLQVLASTFIHFAILFPCFGKCWPRWICVRSTPPRNVD